MSYDIERKKAGREPAFFVELLLDYCSLTFGVGACPAVLGAAGKCYNTRKTCQAASAYDPQPKVYRFLQNGMGWPAGFERIASSLVSVSMSSTQLDPEGGLGIRGAVTLEFQDHPHHDRGVDKYVAERAGNAMEKGTFWGKLRARNPYYKGRVLRLWDGYLPDGVTADTVIEHGRYRDYVIESISPPDASGRVRVVAKDVLKLADGEKAVCPPPSTGALAKPLAVGDTEIALTPGTGEEYGSSGYVQIGDGTMQFTGRDGDLLTGCAWVQGEADSFDAGETVQLVKAWDNVNVVDILADLLVDYAKVPASAIDTAQWAAEKASHLTTFNLTTMITEPTPVREVLNDVLKQCLIACWQDDITGKIHLRALTPWADSVASITDDQIVAGSMSVADQPDKRVSRVRVYHGMRDFAGDADKVANFRRLHFDIDLEREDGDEYGEPAERVFHSRWFTVGNKTAPALLASRLIGRFGQIPQQVGFTLDARHADFKTGDVIDITSRLIQDEHGEPVTTRLLILKTTPDNRGHQVAYKGFTYSPVPVPVIDIKGLKNQFNVFTYLSAPAAPLDVIVNVHPGAVVFSDDPAVAALSSGPLPAGSTITLYRAGQILGCGGKAGAGGMARAIYDPEVGWIGSLAGNGEDGEDGGHAIETSVPITIDNGVGYIRGGGGGGAGGKGYVQPGIAYGGGGGGGGQSYEPTALGEGGDAMGAGPTAAIFRDEAGTKPKPNPFTADSNGKYAFHAAAGSYILLLDYPDGRTETVTGVNIPNDPAEAPPQNLGSGDPEEPIRAGGGGRPPRDYGAWKLP